MSNRQTAHLADLGEVEIERRLHALVSYFDQRWLEATTGHPLQNLWLRKDALATNQLLLLGDAVLSFAPSDSKWLLEKVKEIKKGETNARRGAMFELLGMNLLRGKNRSVKPTPRNCPGYDAIVILPDGAELNVSLKSYGTSTHERVFSLECKKTKDLFVAELRSLGVTGLMLKVVAQAYPAASDWEKLRKALPEILRRPNYGFGSDYTVGNLWAIATHEAPQDVLPLSFTQLSYQVVIFVPYHQNESKNLFDKFNEATANARKHANSLSSDTAHVVLVRLPETISLKACADWAEEYFAQNQDGPLDLVMLYQPTIIDNSDGTSVIHHGFVSLNARKFSKWARPGREIKMEVLIGVCSGSPTRYQLSSGVQIPDIDKMYIYQRGKFFTGNTGKTRGILG